MILAVIASALVAVTRIATPYLGAMSVDAKSGRVLFEQNADAQGYPASVTKILTAMLVLDDVACGRYSLADEVVASPVRTKADIHFRQPSRIGLTAGQKMSVDALLRALMVHSANDAAVFLAEHSAGSVDAFVERMNARAKSLGMTSSRFYNPNGLPPHGGKGGFNVSTCRDLSKLALAVLREHPEMLKYTSVKFYDADLPDGSKMRLVNHNNVMVKNRLKVMNPDGSEAADGLKTGFISAGGSSIVLTGTRSGKRAVVVVLGSANGKIRDAEAARLLSDALSALAW